MNKLHKVRLSNFAVYSQGKQVDVGKQEFERKKGYERFIRIVDYTDTAESPRYIENDTNFVVSENDIIMIRYGSKTAGMAVRGINGIIANNMFKISFEDGVEVKDTEGKFIKIDKNYVFHYLRTNTIYEYLHNGSGSSTMPAISFDLMDTVFLYLPEYHEQVLAGKVLNCIYSKIKNNNKINAELESIAKTLYDYWFLQFEFPNEEGKPYKSSGGKMLWNEELKREIPEGWEVGNLYNIADFINGLACQKYRPVNDTEKLPVIKITEMHDGITANTEFVRSDIPENNIINDGDILFSWSATLETMLWIGGKCGLNQHIFKVIPKNISKYYVFMQLSSYIGNFVKMAEARKTTMGHITTDHLKQSKIILPNRAIAEMFDKKISDVFQMVIKNNQENRELINVRDFLLPLLMNGQVGFKEN